jgi:ABC-type lipoprotein release transport system permease subunit
MFNSKNNYRGSNKIAELMCETENFSLVWYGNNVISTITENETLVKQASNLFLYIALILASFSMFMLFNYIATSIVNKRPSIGVLRGLGSGKKDIMLMFISESIIIAVINAILATILSGVGCILINYYVKNVMNIAIPFALFSARQGVLITVMSILSAILSSALPITKIAKEKPVSLIRRP